MTPAWLRHFRPLSGVCMCLFAVCCFSKSVRALGPGQKNKTSQQVSPAQKPACGNKRAVILRVREFVERARTFQDLDAKVRATSELSSLLWSCETLYAEAVLTDLHESLKSEIKKRQEGSAAAGGQHNLTAAGENRESVPLGKLKYLHSYLLSRINLHNPSLAKRLAENDAAAWGDVSYFTVRTLLGDGDAGRAAAELRKTLASGYGDVELLITLRQSDPSNADSLYSAHLQNLARRSPPTAQEFAEAGGYLFASNPADDNNSVWLVMASVEGTPVPHFTRRRPAASERALRDYLNHVAQLLAQPTESPAEKKARYALGRVLLPYLPRADAALAGAFSTGMQKLAAEVTDGVRNDRAYELLGNAAGQTWDNLDRQLEGIQKIPLTGQRDELCVMLAHALYSGRLYEKALKVVGLMSLSDTRDQLETIIKLAVAHQHLSRKQHAEAQQIAFGVAAGRERAIFWLNSAQILQAGGDGRAASQSILRAVADARREQGAERPLLLLRAAAVAGASDPLLAEQLRLEAFGQLNALEKWRAPKWEAEAVARRAALKFPFPGAAGISFGAVLEPFVKDDPEGSESAVAELKSEQLRAEGLVMLAKHLLANAPRKTARAKPASGGSN